MTSADVPRRPTTDWRALVGSDDEGDAMPLALGVEVRYRDARHANPWGSRPARSATPRDVARGGGEVLLGIRPLERSAASGDWVQGAATWDAVRRSPARYGRRRTRWFADLLSIARDSLLSGTAGDWLLLDHLESPLLWTHLHTAAALGIPLVPTQKKVTVELRDRIAVGAVIRRTDAGDLTVRPEINGAPDDPSLTGALLRPIGRSGLYAVAQTGDRLHVVLAETTAGEAGQSLLALGAAVDIPRHDEEDFLREAYPRLARGVALRTQGAVSLPPLPRPRAVLSLSFRRGDTIEYAFGWDYAGFGRTPIEPDGAGFRDPDAENEVLVLVESVWQQAVGSAFTARGAFHEIEAAEFATHVVPRLEAEGVRVETTGRRKTYTELTGEPELTVSTMETPDSDWFDLGVLVRIDGRVIPFEPLFTALVTGRKKLLLVDGTHFSLQHPALDRLRELLDEAAQLDEWETGPRLHRSQVALWEDFEDLADQALPALAWRELAEGLRDAATVPSVPPPAGLRAELRPYQQQGLDWLAFLWSHGLGGILADDMGLGKTLQILALILRAREAGEQRPFLVIAPTSVVGGWRAEAERFAPGLRVQLRDATRASGLAAPLDADVVVTTYAVARLDEPVFTGVEWAALVLDEAQFVKNPATKLHRAIAGIPARAVYAVTGTPLENGLSELWALLSLTAPGLFPSARAFRERYILPIEQGKVPENAEGGEYRARRLAQLRRRMRPLVLRRTKELVADELPTRQEQILDVELGSAHRELYETVLQRERQKILGLLPELDRHRFIVFRSLTLLRMLALSPALIDPAHARIGSRKLDVLLERVVELQQEGHRALVFSQFTSFLDLAAERLSAAGISYSRLDGSTSRRQAVVDGFREGDQPVFLISLKAGGFGLTLTEADYVFLLDPWWNPAAEAQAVDRAHRIGQTAQVFVYRLVATGTIEEKVVELQRRKARLFSAVMDDEALFAQSLTAEDIQALLG